MYVASVGMVCSVGLNAAAACAAMRAGIARFEELPYLDQRVEPIIGATVPGLDEGLRRHERLLELLRACQKSVLASMRRTIIWIIAT